MEKPKKTVLFLIIIILLLLVCIIGGLVWYIVTSRDIKPQEEKVGIGYESTVVVDNPNALQDAVDGMIRQAAEGSMTLEMNTEAVSEDGRTFKCRLGNAENNRYDMFVVIYRDDTQEEIYRSKLIPIGTHIEEFVVDKTIEPGKYEGTIVYNQVEEDHDTIHAQVNAGLDIVVKEQTE